MATFLQSLSLAFSLMNNDPSAHDGRLVWPDYAWVEPGVGACLDQAEGLCHASHEKWDWKRNQWVDFSYGVANGKLTTRLTLTNGDRSDTDYVCVTALFVDAAGNDIYAFHQNWHVRPQQVLDHSYTEPLSGAAWSKVATVVIGSKQCRDGANQDDDLFAQVKAQIGQQ